MTHTVNHVISLSPELQALLEKHMPSLDEFNAKLDTISTKITEVAAEIADLKAQLAAGGLSADQEQAVFDRLATLETALDSAK
jgi:chorismate mutase